MKNAVLALVLLLACSCRKEPPEYSTVRYQVQCGSCTVSWGHLGGSVTREVTGGIDAEGSVQRGSVALLNVWSAGPSNAVVTHGTDERRGSGTDYSVSLGVPY